MNEAHRFIHANTVVQSPPLLPELGLHLASEIVPIWQKTEAELQKDGLAPPFWAFAWAGGQALARFVLDNASEVRDLSVFDFASGSGLVAIAAKKAGARHVLASEIDPMACAAIQLNAQLNGVDLEISHRDWAGVQDNWDVVLAGDICYEREMSSRVFSWLRHLASHGTNVLIGDPGRNYLPVAHLIERATYEVQTTRELEDCDIRRTTIWAIK